MRHGYPSLVRGFCGGVLTIALGGCGGEETTLVRECPADDAVILESGEAPYLGRPGAEVQVAVFGDLTCPYTVQMLLALGAYMDELSRRGEDHRVEVQFRHLRRASTDEIPRALEAACLQGNDPFWGLTWCLILAENITEETLSACASTFVPDKVAFELARENDEVLIPIARDEAIAGELGFTGTPGMLLCGIPVSPEPDDIKKNIDMLLSD